MAVEAGMSLGAWLRNKGRLQAIDCTLGLRSYSARCVLVGAYNRVPRPRLWLLPLRVREQIRFRYGEIGDTHVF